MVEDLLATMGRGPWDLTLFYSPATKEWDIRHWLGAELPLVPQSGSDLGERLDSAFAWAEENAYERTVVIGSDIPELQAEHISDAFERLKTADVVLGPARDGGYYLIGLRQRSPELFADLEWGTPRVLEETLERVGRVGLTCSLLGERTDIDSWDDAVLLHARLAGRAASGLTVVAPRTIAELDRLMGSHQQGGNDD